MLLRRIVDKRGGRGAQRLCRGGHVLRRRAAAAADDLRPAGVQDRGLRREIARLAVVIGAVAAHGGIAGVRHHGKKAVDRSDPAHKLDHLASAGDAVQPHGVDIGVRRRGAAQLADQAAVAREAVGLRGKGDEHEGLGVRGLDVRGDLVEIEVRPDGFKQKMPGAEREELVDDEVVFLQKVGVVARVDRTDVGKDIGVLAGGAAGDQPALAEDGGAVLRREILAVGAVGVRLDRAAAHLEIGAVDRLDLTGGAEIGPLAVAVARPVARGVIGPHAAVEQQHAVFAYKRSDLLHPSTFFAMSAPCLASLA